MEREILDRIEQLKEEIEALPLQGLAELYCFIADRAKIVYSVRLDKHARRISISREIGKGDR